MRRVVFSIFLSFFAAACYANEVQVSVQFITTGGATWSTTNQSYYVYPYYFDVRVNGAGGAASIIALCDDARHDIVADEYWMATERQLTQTAVGDLLFKESDGLLNGLKPLQAYYYAGFIMTQLTAYSWDVKNAAIWRLFSPLMMAADPAIDEVYAAAGVGGPIPEEWSFPVMVYTPLYVMENGVPRLLSNGQEIMQLTPEPATLALIGSALLALGFAGRRRLRQ